MGDNSGTEDTGARGSVLLIWMSKLQIIILQVVDQEHLMNKILSTESWLRGGDLVKEFAPASKLALLHLQNCTYTQVVEPGGGRHSWVFVAPTLGITTSAPVK